MKHFPVSLVLVGEEKISWHVAEQHNDDSSDKTTAPVGRSAKPFAGTGRGTARTFGCRGPVAARSTPSRLLRNRRPCTHLLRVQISVGRKSASDRGVGTRPGRRNGGLFLFLPGGLTSSIR